MTDTAPTLPAIPVQAAKQFAEHYEADIGILVAWARADGRLRVATWGRESSDKTHAAAAGSIIGRALGSDMSRAETYQDHRQRRLDEIAAAVERLTAYLTDPDVVEKLRHIADLATDPMTTPKEPTDGQ